MLLCYCLTQVFQHGEKCLIQSTCIMLAQRRSIKIIREFLIGNDHE
ncbi:Uncharacterised protein [Segatella copri]|nr:Uncharacterised protein [Segatella copri]